MISNGDMAARIVRYGELVPCRTAFIDTYNPGSDRKENFTIVGGGVSENPDQHVHICDTPGFNIGAAGQPPNCRNSLHSHHTAEVFIVLKGRWRFFWGRWGQAGEVVLEDGDIFNIPTGIFRGFENIGQCHGMLFAVLGGDDAGGGVVWAPQVIEEGRKNGMILSASGQLYDRNRGEELPAGDVPMPTLSDAELSAFPEIPVGQVVPRFVARRWDMKALSANAPAPVIGDKALIVDRPGFTVDFLSCGATANEMTASEKHEILLVTEGHWKLTWQGGDTVLAPGDTCAVPPDTPFNIAPAVSGENGMFRVRGTDDPAGPTWNF